MIILIGGASCTGKTLMAQKLLERYHLPYLSLDHLKMGLIRGGSYGGFSAMDSDEEIAAALWPIIKGMIMTAIENNQNLIVEGCYLLPEYVKDFNEQYSREIVSVFIIFSRNYIENNFSSGILQYRNIIERRCFQEDRPITQFTRDHQKIRNKCVENGAKYFEIEHDYESEIHSVYEHLDNIHPLNRGISSITKDAVDI